MIFPPAERDKELGHGDEYDGIEEYDNALPAWWLGILFFSIVWGVGYAVHYHTFGERSQAGEYQQELATAAAMWPASKAPTTVEVDADGLAAGKQVYETNCVACHGADMTGGIGPSLVDDEWIHGSSREDMIKTIEQGVLDKGMPAWGQILGPAKVAQVAAWIDEQT